MPLLSKDKAYEQIGSLSSVLGLEDQQTISVLVATGLGRLEKGRNRRFCVVKKAWEKLILQIPGLIYIPKYGASRHPVVSLGGENTKPFNLQLKRQSAAPTYGKQMLSALLNRFKSNVEVQRALDQATTDNSHNLARSTDSRTTQHRGDSGDTATPHTGTRNADGQPTNEEECEKPISGAQRRNCPMGSRDFTRTH